MSFLCAFAIVSATLLALPSDSSAIRQVKYVGEFDAGTPVAIAVDDGGRVYTAQKDGTVTVNTMDGKLVTKISGKNWKGEPILKKPSGLFYSDGNLYVTDEGMDNVSVFKKDGKYLFSFGRDGDEAREFDDPHGIFVFGGVIFVADTGNSRVQVFGPDGIWMKSFGMEGPEETRLLKPTDIGIDPDGDIYVLDEDAQSVKVYTLDGKYIKAFKFTGEPCAISVSNDGFIVADAEKKGIKKLDFRGNSDFSFGTEGKGRAQFLDITGITFDSEERVFVSDRKRKTVQVFQPEGTSEKAAVYVHPPPTAVKWNGYVNANASAILWDGKERLYAINPDNDKIQVIRRSRVEKSFTIPDARPVAMALDKNDNLWVLDQKKGRILKLDRGGNVLFSFGSSGDREGYLSKPTDIAINIKGFIIVADRGNGWVQLFNSDGMFLKIIGKSFIESPLSVAEKQGRHVFVLDDKKKTVMVLTIDGKPEWEFGKEGTPGELVEPVSMSVSENEVFVLDKGTNSVKAFTHNGNFLWEFGSEGSGKGDLGEPADVTVKNDLELFVSEPENKRIQAFKTIYTPNPPEKLLAQTEGNSIKLNWKKSPESYVRAYNVFRAEQSNENPVKIAEVKQNSYVDSGRTPQVKYFYSVTAIARDGNESLPGHPITVTIKK